PPKSTLFPYTTLFRSLSSTTTSKTILQGQIYTDPKLGFQLTTPRNWQPQPQPGSQATSSNAAVTFTVDEQSTHPVIVIGVFHGPDRKSTRLNSSHDQI